MKNALKVIFLGVLMVGLLLGANQFGLEMRENRMEAKAVETTVKIKESTPYNDEYAFFTYEITSVNGDEINGVALDNITPENAGIFLYQSDVNAELTVGDKVTVVFDAGVHDDIVDVIKQ